jgi:flagellar biosynthetic protein FliR
MLSRAGIAEISRAFALGFTLAAPFVIASLIYNVTLGVINKAMPQLMVAFVGAPAITAGGLVLLMLAAPLMLSIWVESMALFIMDPFKGPG